jgi:hypothetical protein
MKSASRACRSTRHRSALEAAPLRQRLLMYVTSIWSVLAVVVTVLETWTPRLPELLALPSKTGCTMRRTGCQILQPVCGRAFLQVRAHLGRALSLTATTGWSYDASHPHTVLLQAVARALTQHLPTKRSQRCPLQPVDEKPGPLPLLSRRKHATMRPQSTNCPPRMPPSAHAGPQPRGSLTPSTSRARPSSCEPRRCAGGLQGRRRTDP